MSKVVDIQDYLFEQEDHEAMAYNAYLQAIVREVAEELDLESVIRSMFSKEAAKEESYKIKRGDAWHLS